MTADRLASLRACWRVRDTRPASPSMITNRGRLRDHERPLDSEKPGSAPTDTGFCEFVASPPARFSFAPRTRVVLCLQPNEDNEGNVAL